MFRVGQKVVCVDDTNYGPVARARSPAQPKRGHVYTVRNVVHHAGKNYLRVYEIYADGSSHSVFGEGAWCAARFRPLVERKTSIEVFKAMLNPTPEKVLEIVGHGAHENGRKEREGAR